MKIERLAKNGWVETFLLNDRFIISHLYICQKDGPRGDVKVFDVKSGKELVQIKND